MKFSKPRKDKSVLLTIEPEDGLLDDPSLAIIALEDLVKGSSLNVMESTELKEDVIISIPAELYSRLQVIGIMSALKAKMDEFQFVSISSKSGK